MTDDFTCPACTCLVSLLFAFFPVKTAGFSERVFGACSSGPLRCLKRGRTLRQKVSTAYSWRMLEKSNGKKYEETMRTYRRYGRYGMLMEWFFSTNKSEIFPICNGMNVASGRWHDCHNALVLVPPQIELGLGSWSTAYLISLCPHLPIGTLSKEKLAQNLGKH